jgi:hypothetical protein
MDTRAHSRRYTWVTLALVIPLVLACGIGSSVAASPTMTATPGPTATPAPPPHAIAWIQQDGTNTPQIWASFNDGAPTQITHQPTIAPECGTEIFGSPVFSPDLRHIAVADGSTCGDGEITGQVHIVTVSSGAISNVALPYPGGVLTDQRTYGWIDNATVFILGNFQPNPGGLTYTLGAGAAVALPGMPGRTIEGVVRGSTLFYLTAVDSSVGGYPNEHTYLHRYNLSTHAAIPGAVDLGAFDMCLCSPGDFHYQGWDASPDGLHLVYQVTAPGTPTGSLVGITSQAIYYANADSSGATQIVRYMVTHSSVRLRISPNGNLVGITEAHGTPDVLSGCVHSPGLHGDPCLQFYSPDAQGYPAWRWDSGYMIAMVPGSSTNGALYRDTLGNFTGVVYAAAGYNPWSTP